MKLNYFIRLFIRLLSKFSIFFSSKAHCETRSIIHIKVNKHRVSNVPLETRALRASRGERIKKPKGKKQSFGKKSIIIFASVYLANYAIADPVDEIYQTETVKHFINQLIKANHIPGVAVDLIVNGNQHQYFFGEADLATGQPVTGKTLFEIGSVSKLFTSLLLAENIKAGRASLNEHIGSLLPDFNARIRNFNNITLAQLATHTSGLPFDAPSDVQSRGALLSFLGKRRLPEAGKTWLYSNIGMGILGDCLEAIEHENYNQLYRKNILAPLGMSPIGIDVPMAYMPYYAQGYQGNGTEAHRVQLGGRQASGSIKASANDMMQFLKAAIGLPGTPAFLLSSIRLTQTPFVELTNFNQGLGWQMYKLDAKRILQLLHPAAIEHIGPFPVRPIFFLARHFDGQMLIDKTGTTAGFRTYIAVIPERQTGIVLLVNKRISDTTLLPIARNILFRVNGMA